MVRVLLCGDLRGRLSQLCDNITKLHSKLEPAQHFRAVFCVGEFTIEDSASRLEPDVKPPIPVYFVDAGPGAEKLVQDCPQGKEVQPGVHFLGHFGVTRIEGLTVAFLSGRYREELFPPPASAADAQQQADSAAANLTWEDIRAAEKAAEKGQTELFIGSNYTPLAIERLKEEIAEAAGIDLLLTAEWPAGCLRGVPKEARAELEKARVAAASSPAVAEVAVAAEPKYHAVGLGGAFWRRPPWRHQRRGEVVASTGELRCGVCRIVSLGAAAPAGGGSKDAEGSSASPAAKPQKWLHGLDLDPNLPPAAADDATPSPWSPEAVKGAGAAGELGPWQTHFESADPEERRRWMRRFGATPEDLQSAGDKMAQSEQPGNAEKKKKRQSLYPTEKDNKRKRGGGEGEHFSTRERKAAGRVSAGSYF